MSKDKDKRLEEKEKWDAEVARSLSIVELKKAHKQIEDVEKLRKREAIKSIRERLLSLGKYCKGIQEGIEEAQKENPKINSSDLPLGDNMTKLVTSVISMYESIRLDLQRNIDINKEDFDRLFPKSEIDMSNYGKFKISLACLRIQVTDMVDYIMRLL